MTFKQWILQFTDSNLADGDLARDIEQDDFFPISNRYGEIYDYLQVKGASQAALKLFQQSWEEYNK